MTHREHRDAIKAIKIMAGQVQALDTTLSLEQRECLAILCGALKVYIPPLCAVMRTPHLDMTLAAFYPLALPPGSPDKREAMDQANGLWKLIHNLERQFPDDFKTDES